MRGSKVKSLPRDESGDVQGPSVLNQATLDALVHRPGTRPAGPSEWQVRCPCPNHGKGRGDRNPSVTVKVDGDRVLVHCHAGCATEEVMGALGMTVTDLMPLRLHDGGDRFKARYRYTDADGGLVFKVVRFRDGAKGVARRPCPGTPSQWLVARRVKSRRTWRAPAAPRRTWAAQERLCGASSKGSRRSRSTGLTCGSWKASPGRRQKTAIA